MAGLLAGLPVEVPGETVNRLCASGMAAVVHAYRAISCNEGDVFIAGGVENMSRGPYVISKSAKPFGTDAQMYDSSFGWRFINPKMQEMYGTDAMGMTAENLVALYGISREDQDVFAFRSQQKAGAAQKESYFEGEIAPVPVAVGKGDSVLVTQDEFVKPQTTLEGLAKLKAAFKKEGSVTAGNSSGLNDGAAALLIASDKGLKVNNLTPLARIVSSAVTGVEPRIMGIGPVSASLLALERAGLVMDDMDLIEINEAFAAQALSCTRQLGLADDDPRINPKGGAIALGHPLGMSGARILLTAARQLQESGKKYALCTMCIGVGQGYAVVLERAS
jgi:acetyl-CoA acetyltransferase family protein